MNLGENIYALRTKNNMSQTDLAHALDVSRQSVSKWENNSAVPDLDRLINMSRLFNVTLDELVFGQKSRTDTISPETVTQLSLHLNPRVTTGAAMLVFGMIFFLLSIFWGDHLWFGEEIGELLSTTITLIAVSVLATNNFKVFAGCTVIYLIYSSICYGIIKAPSLANYTFIFVAGCILLIWFISWGTNANKGVTDAKKENGEIVGRDI